MFQLVFGSITILGIAITLIGSVLMPKYHNKKPTHFEVRKLLDKEQVKRPEEKLDFTVDITLEPYMVGGREEQMRVTKNVAQELSFRRKLPISLLITGSGLAIISLFFQ